MTNLIIVLISLATLIKSVDIFIDQSIALAKKWGASDFIIGFTVVAFGTSLPELISIIFSSISGHNQLVVSNVIGSNITNLCLIFGIVALVKEYRIRKRDVNINIPINIIALAFFWIIAVWAKMNITWIFGIALLISFFALMLLSKEKVVPSKNKNVTVIFKGWLLFTSLIVLVIAGKTCVDGIISLADQLDISEKILGYFLLAIGTSLPELITTWEAVRKSSGELGVGNILGSNLYNLLFILGVTSFINPVKVTNFVPDLIFLTGATIATYYFAMRGKKYTFSRKEGFTLLGIYGLFIIMQIFRV